MAKDPRLFDIIVLAGMVVNIILAVFLLIYYFDLLWFILRLGPLVTHSV